MEFYKSLSIHQHFDKKVFINQEYSERLRHVNQTGGDYVVIYDFIILPNHTDSIVVFFEDDKYPEQWCTQPTKECIPYISEGVEEFTRLLKENEITCNGFDFRVSNACVHPVDFRTSAYRRFTTKRLIRLINDLAGAEHLLID